MKYEEGMLDQMLLKGAKAAREACATFLAREEHTAKNINKIIANMFPYLMTLDRFSRLGRHYLRLPQGRLA